MFKKKHIDKKIDLSKDIQSIEIPQKKVDKSLLSKKISKPEKELSHSEQKQEARKVNRYGLIQKEAEVEQKPKVQENLLLKLYIKRRMEEINAEKERQVVDTTTSEILQMQKQYLSAAESKITEYDVKEVQKKLQKMATESIKNQLQNRSRYLNELLQNEHQRMQYASKKELKMMKQERQRLEKELSSKYSSEGRRHYIQYLKQQNLKELK